MARAIKFLRDYGRVKNKKAKKLVGGFKKGDIWDKCSAQLAQKLVNRLGVAEYVKDRVGDDAAQKVAGSNKAIEKAKADAKKIIDDAKAEAVKIKAEAAKKDGDLT